MQPCVQTAGAQIQLGGELVGGAPAPFLLQSGVHCITDIAAAEETSVGNSGSPAAVWLSSQSCACIRPRLLPEVLAVSSHG